MGKRQSKPSDSSDESTGSSEPDGKHAPRSYTAREQLIFGVKLFAIVGFLVLLLWLLDKYV